MFRLKFLKQEEATGNGEGGGGQAPTGTVTPEGQAPKASPNSDWKKDGRLDANGNPLPADQVKPDTKPTDKPNEKPTDKTADKPTDKQNGVELDTKTEQKVDFNSPVIKQVETLVTDSGLDSKEVVKAVNDNGGKVTPAILKALVDKHGESVGALIANQLEGFHVATTSKAKEKDKAIYDSVAKAFEGVTEQSGEDTWKELSSWAKENIPIAERKEINAALAQGGKIANYAINDLVSQFKSKYEVKQDAELLTGDTANQGGGFKPLTKNEYTRELRELESKGHIYGQSQEMSRLDERRRRSMERGI